MDERIREFAIQSGLPTALDYHQKRYEKFAESIIQECVRVVNAADDSCEDYYGTIIKEHFGVES
jgi:hypothetical protein